MNKLLAVGALLSLSCLMQACGNDAKATSPPPKVEYEILHGSFYNEFAASTSKSAVVITNEPEYEHEILKRTSEQPKTINFAQASILLIDMGSRNSGGYGIEVSSIEENSDHLLVTIELAIPGESCAVTLAFTNPYKFIKITTQKEILVTEKLVNTEC